LQERVAQAIAVNVSDVLAGASFFGVVNAPDFSAVSKHPFAVPYMSLLERLGTVLGQLLRGRKIKSVHVNLRGKDICGDSTVGEVLTTAAVKGLLNEFLSRDPLNLVNSLATAREMGLPVSMNMSTGNHESDVSASTGGYVNMVSVKVQIDPSDIPQDSPFLSADGSVELSGTVLGTGASRELRLVKLNDFQIQLPLVVTNGSERTLLLFNNKDEPGVLDGLLHCLLREGVGIAHFAAGRRVATVSTPTPQAGGSSIAVGAVVLDAELSPSALTQLQQFSAISNVTQVGLLLQRIIGFTLSVSRLMSLLLLMLLD
jgi:hypothetical protein